MYSVSYNNTYNKQLANKIGKYQSQQTNDGYVNPYPEPIQIPPRYTLPQTKKQIINKANILLCYDFDLRGHFKSVVA